MWGCALVKINGGAEAGWKHFFEQNFLPLSGWGRAFWLTMKHTFPKMVSWGSCQVSLEASVEWAASHEKTQHGDPSQVGLPNLLPHGLLGSIQVASGLSYIFDPWEFILWVLPWVAYQVSCLLLRAAPRTPCDFLNSSGGHAWDPSTCPSLEESLLCPSHRSFLGYNSISTKSFCSGSCLNSEGFESMCLAFGLDVPRGTMSRDTSILWAKFHQC